MVEPGEPYFLQQDTDLAVALAEEERDTCPLCGMPKAWCRDPANQYGVFEPHEEQCHAAYAVGAYRKQKAAGRDDVAQASVQAWARFVEGKEPDLASGLELPEDAAE